MKNILSRISLISKNEGITIGFLEKKIGASKGVLSRAIQNGTDIQSKWIQQMVENYPQYNAEWLLTGKGEMLKVDRQEVPVRKDSTEGDATPIYNGMPHECVYKDMLKEKEAEIKELNREIGALQARLSEKKTAAVRHHHHSVELQEVEERL